ncbi:unnamed protein product [Nesidiocoris tenuis]|uniref:Uncharacterized protein n=1 Tax=Nesidiocoris tenuis TaxID=355587 RepID=A0A6H5HD61_9HEMI|nr:unnamed protein product [Nesidiocoris tenuis]
MKNWNSAIISAFDSVAKGWTPVPAPQSWRTLPPKVWLKGQQPSASSANSQHLASASAMGHNHPHQASYGLWASQQKSPIPAMVFMKQIPVPYPVTDQKQVPVKIAVPVNKPYLGYISRPYQIFMENKTPYPVPAPYAVENRIPVPVKVPVQRPYPVPEVQVPVQVPVEKPYIIHVPVEKRVPYPVEKPVPVPVQIQVEKPVPVQVEKRVPVYIERRVPVYIQKLVPYPVKIPIRVPVPVPYYAQPPPNSNQHSNYFRPSPSFHQEPEGSQGSFHQVMLFPKKARHEQNHDDYRSNQQVDPDYPAGANHDENEEEESDSDRTH